MRLFIDECGFTGEDLANQDQPVFALASTGADEAFSKEVVEKIFRGVQSPELKHKSLVRTAAGRQRVVDFLEAIRGSGLFATYVVHKEFCLLTKLADLWLEPALRLAGIDFYERGANLGFSNMAWFCLRTFESPSFLSKHLSRFQEMLRTRSRQSQKAFWGTLHRDVQRCRPETGKILGYFLLSSFELGAGYLSRLPERSLDISMTAALQIIGHWRGSTTEDIEVYHDDSSTMSREKWLWDAITSSELPSFRVGRVGFAVDYPLRVPKTEFCDSRRHLQLQLADIVAGATVAWSRSLLRGAKKTEYASALKRAGIAEHLVGGVWPTPNVDPIPDETGSISASKYIDLMSEIIGGAVNELYSSVTGKREKRQRE